MKRMTYPEMMDEINRLEQELATERENFDNANANAQRLRAAIAEYLPLVEAYRDAVTEYDPDADGVTKIEMWKRTDLAIFAERECAKRLRTPTDEGVK